MRTWIVAEMGPDAVLTWRPALKVSGAPLFPEVCGTPAAADSTARPITIRDETDTKPPYVLQSTVWTDAPTLSMFFRATLTGFQTSTRSSTDTSGPASGSLTGTTGGWASRENA